MRETWLNTCFQSYKHHEEDKTTTAFLLSVVFTKYSGATLQKGPASKKKGHNSTAATIWLCPLLHARNVTVSVDIASSRAAVMPHMYLDRTRTVEPLPLR